MVIIRDSDFRIVKQSRNLRGILEYSRMHAVARIDVYQGKGEHPTGQLGIVWVDGATTITDFASYRVMRDWVNARRAFRGVTVVEH